MGDFQGVIKHLESLTPNIRWIHKVERKNQYLNVFLQLIGDKIFISKHQTITINRQNINYFEIEKEIEDYYDIKCGGCVSFINI